MIKIEKNNDGTFPEVWIFSDPHYNHSNICRGTTNWRTIDGKIPEEQTRDFTTLEKMNESILNGINWNEEDFCIRTLSGFYTRQYIEMTSDFHDRVPVK